MNNMNGVRNGTGHKTAEILQQYAVDANADIGNSSRIEENLMVGLGIRNAYGLQHNSQKSKRL